MIMMAKKKLDQFETRKWLVSSQHFIIILETMIGFHWECCSLNGELKFNAMV